ncbi:MAG: efflux RND transporter permease subunit, partial [Planctomycetota bacterium]|nr:efflux RND transporter permease subunit [Planctomycetota bacterium]
CNAQGRDLGSTVKDIQESIEMDVSLPTGYSIVYGGQFESQQRATRLLLILGTFSLVAMFGVLFAYFKSVALVVQVMLNVPFAFIGSVAALLLAGESFSVASLVGFISLTGIASRNGILMISHYVHLMTQEGMKFGRELVVRGSQERVAPVLMTALTSGLALVPLVLSKGEAGKEILYPVALVVLGGLLTSTLLDFAVTPTIFFNYSGKAAARVAEGLLERNGGTATGAGGAEPQLPSSESEPEQPGKD